MKYALATWLLVFPILVRTGCGAPAIIEDDQKHFDENSLSVKDTLVIQVGDQTFTATLLSNPAATEFKAMLPLRITMTELNGNEKYFSLSKNLPADASDPGTINSGDIMLWGSNTIVIFYKTFQTTYSYTKIGRITNTTGLAAALGTGNPTVIFSLRE